MAQDNVRMNLQVSVELNDLLGTIAHERGASRTDVIRQAIALMKVAQDTRNKGKHLGIVADPAKLDTEIVGLL